MWRCHFVSSRHFCCCCLVAAQHGHRYSQLPISSSRLHFSSVGHSPMTYNTRSSRHASKSACSSTRLCTHSCSIFIRYISFRRSSSRSRLSRVYSASHSSCIRNANSQLISISIGKWSSGKNGARHFSFSRSTGSYALSFRTFHNSSNNNNKLEII